MWETGGVGEFQKKLRWETGRKIALCDSKKLELKKIAKIL